VLEFAYLICKLVNLKIKSQIFLLLDIDFGSVVHDLAIAFIEKFESFAHFHI